MSLISDGQQRARDELHFNYGFGRSGDKKYWSDYIKQSDLHTFKENAYESSTGYSIRINPHTGYKEMFIAGSSDSQDWVSNVVEGLEHLGVGTPIGFLSEHEKIKFANHLQDIATKENVDVVYGHSRGVSIMSYMDSDDQIRIGLDGASVIGARSHYVNLDGTSFFDRLISAGHKENVVLTDRIFHDVTETRSERKERKKRKRESKKKEPRTEPKTKPRTEPKTKQKTEAKKSTQIVKYTEPKESTQIVRYKNPERKREQKGYEYSQKLAQSTLKYFVRKKKQSRRRR